MLLQNIVSQAHQLSQEYGAVARLPKQNKGIPTICTLACWMSLKQSVHGNSQIKKSFGSGLRPFLKKPLWMRIRGGGVNSNFDDYRFEDMHGAVNAISQSLIRVEANELNYQLHVILWYQIKKDVIAGNLKLIDISSRWNQDMKKTLNIKVPWSHDKGALQDVHW
jgi:hypothetical protein